MRSPARVQDTAAEGRPGETPLRDVALAGVVQRNAAWVQLLGLCPLLAVSSSVVNAIGLALASAFVLIGTNTLVSIARHWIDAWLRLPAFVLIIAAFTTAAVMWLEAYAYPLYVQIALFVQIIVTNCMILGRAEQFASRNTVLRSILDAVGTATGFALALIALGIVRELFGAGTLFAGMEHLLGDGAAQWTLHIIDAPYTLSLLRTPPGAFLAAGLLLAALQGVRAGLHNAKTNKHE